MALSSNSGHGVKQKASRPQRASLRKQKSGGEENAMGSESEITENTKVELVNGHFSPRDGAMSYDEQETGFENDLKKKHNNKSSQKQIQDEPQSMPYNSSSLRQSARLYSKVQYSSDSNSSFVSPDPPKRQRGNGSTAHKQLTKPGKTETSLVNNSTSHKEQNEQESVRVLRRPKKTSQRNSDDLVGDSTDFPTYDDEERRRQKEPSDRKRLTKPHKTDTFVVQDSTSHKEQNEQDSVRRSRRPRKTSQRNSDDLVGDSTDFPTDDDEERRRQKEPSDRKRLTKPHKTETSVVQDSTSHKEQNEQDSVRRSRRPKKTSQRNSDNLVADSIGFPTDDDEERKRQEPSDRKRLTKPHKTETFVVQDSTSHKEQNEQDSVRRSRRPRKTSQRNSDDLVADSIDFPTDDDVDDYEERRRHNKKPAHTLLLKRTRQRKAKSELKTNGHHAFSEDMHSEHETERVQRTVSNNRGSKKTETGKVNTKIKKPQTENSHINEQDELLDGKWTEEEQQKLHE